MEDSDRVAVPVFGVVARTGRGRDLLTPEHLHRWVRAWTAGSDPADWWCDRDEGVALFRPQLVRAGPDGRQAALSIRGIVRSAGRAEPPAGWPTLATATGTDIVLHDLLERDTAAVDALRGQFAFAAWDGRRRRLLLGRDHLGHRGMFWRHEPDLTAFCSDLEPLLTAAGTVTTMDAEATLWYLAFGMPPPGRTMARGVERLPAAHVLAWEPGRPSQVIRYWTPLHPDAPPLADDEFVAAFRSTLDRAVQSAMPSVGDVGVLLSGGVDSTHLAATLAAMGLELHAFTAAFEPAHGMNETEYAVAVADWLKMDHRVVTVSAHDALAALDVMLSAVEPCAAWATLTHDRILTAARTSGIGTVLSGLGADEILGGYDHFRGFYARYLRYERQHPPPGGATVSDALLMTETQSARRVLYPGIARFFDDAALRAALTQPYHSWHYASRLRAFYRECQSLKPEAHPMELMVAHECQHRIPDLLLANFAPLSRQHGVDVHYPFLDPDVVRLAAGLSPESKYRTPTGRFSLRLRALHPRFKHAMLCVAADRVPRVILDRPRKSFTAPFGGWMTDPAFARPVVTRLRHSSFWDEGIVRRETLDELLDPIEPQPSPRTFQLWALLTLTGWWDRFVDPRPG